MFVSQFAPHNLCSTRPCAPPYAPPHAPSPTGTLSSFSITRFSASPIVTPISNVHFANCPYFRSSTTPYASPTSSPAHHQVSQQFAFPKSYRHLYIQCSFCKLPLLQIFHYTLRFPHFFPGAPSNFLVIRFPQVLSSPLYPMFILQITPTPDLPLHLTLPPLLPRRTIKFLSNSLSPSPIVTSISNVHFANYPYSRSPTRPYAHSTPHLTPPTLAPLYTPLQSPAQHQVS